MELRGAAARRGTLLTPRRSRDQSWRENIWATEAPGDDMPSVALDHVTESGDRPSRASGPGDALVGALVISTPFGSCEETCCSAVPTYL
jgi:hypothetical protein